MLLPYGVRQVDQVVRHLLRNPVTPGHGVGERAIAIFFGWLTAVAAAVSRPWSAATSSGSDVSAGRPEPERLLIVNDEHERRQTGSQDHDRQGPARMTSETAPVHLARQ
jgi:hypothetical protein